MRTFGLEEAAMFLNVSTDTLKDLAGSGVVPGAKIGKAWVFSDESMADYLRGEIKKQTAERARLNGLPAADAAKSSVPTTYTRTVRRSPRKPPPLPAA